MEYKHRKRRTTAAAAAAGPTADKHEVHYGQWTPTYYGGSNLELSLDRQTTKTSLHNSTTTTAAAVATANNGYYGALVSPTAAAAGIHSTTTDAAATNNNNNNNNSFGARRRRGRSKSAPKGRDEDGINYGQLNSPPSSQPSQLQPQLQQPQCHPKVNVALSRSKSAEKNRRAASAGRVRTRTSAAAVTSERGGGSNVSNGRKGWGGFLRRKKHTNARQPQPQQQQPQQSIATNSNSQAHDENNNVCDYCHQIVHEKKRWQMYQRLNYAYCSTNCTRRHQQVLEAVDEIDALAITAGTAAANNNSNSNNNSSLNFVEKSGFSSPPITPSAALLIQQQNQQHQNNNNKKGNNAANIHHGNGKQFFPSNAAVAVASNSSSEGQLHNTSPNNGNGKKKKQWFEEENEDNDNNNSSSLEESATRSGGGSNNFGIASHSQDSNISSQSWSRQSQNCNSIHSKHHATTTTTTATTPAASASIRISYGGRRGIGISDEYHRDYNDELSRQLRLAARQDELEYEERQFGNNVHPPPERRGVPPISYSPGETSSSTPAGRRYTGLLKRMGVVNGIDENAATSCTSSTNNNNNTIKSNSSGGLVGRNRRRYPMMKQNENSTQSTVESVSSSSQGGASISQHVIVVGSSLNQSPGTFASPATNLGWGRNTIAREEEPRRRRQQQQQQQGTRSTTASTISPFPTTTKMTKSNDSVVSIHSSMASWGYLDVGGNDDNGGGKKTSSFENEKKFIDTSSWAVGVQSNNRTNSEAKRAFERLSGWPYNEDDEIIIMPEEGQEVEDYNRMREEDTKTPRKGNLSVKHVVAEANDRHVAHNTNVNGNNNQGSSGWNADKDVADWLGRNDNQKKEKKDHSSEKKASKKYERQVSSLSTVSKSPPSSLHSISEEQSFGMTDHNGNHHNHNELHLQSSVRFLAQKRGLRSIGPPGPSSRPITRSEAVELARADRAVEDVVSLVSYYDDPSLESLATNDDTLTTATSGPRGSPTYSSKGTRRQPPSGVHPGLEQRTITTKTRSKTFTGRKQQQQQHHQSQQASRSDPPGNSIDELLKAGIRSPPRPHEHRVNNRHHYRRDPSFHDAQHGLEPSFHGMEPEDYQEQLMQIHEEQRRQQQHDDIVPVETVYPKQRRSLQRQEQRISYPQQHPQQQQQQRHAHFLEHGADQSPDIQTPPRLRQQEWQWSENNTGPSIHQPLLDADDVRKEPSNEDENQFFFNNDQDEEEPEDDFFHVGNIEFPNPEKMFLEEEDSTSIGKLTDEGDDDDEPPLEEAKPDDDTVANTLDTVDLVAEVKRVWRHVQRYEKKKQTKKQLRRQYSNNYHSGGGDHADDGNMLNSVDEDMSVDENPMDALMQQFNELQTAANQQQHQHHHDGDSKFSDITPSSHQVVTANTAAGVTSSRGRSSERPPMTPPTAGDGRLGKHIRSTSAHSRTHTPTVPASPGLDSNYAMTSHCSTEKDVVFLHEGVDEFYDEGRQPVQLMTNHQYQDSHDNYVPAPAATGVQQKSRRRQNQPSKSVLGKLQRSSPNTLQQYSKSHSNEEEDGEPMNNPHDSRREELLLSKPYDMTKTKSTGTSFTQKTQKISNITTNNNGPSPSVLRTEMARKYMKHRSSPPNSNAGLQRQQQQPSHYQTQQQKQQQQRSSTTNSSSVLHSKAMQNARDKRRMIINNNRVS